MNFTDPTTFTIDITAADIASSSSAATNTCLVVALERVYSDLTNLQTNVGLTLDGGQLVGLCNIALDSFVYVTDQLTAAKVAIQQLIGTKPAPFTATLTIGQSL